MADHDVIVIGASADGVDPIYHQRSTVSADLPPVVFVVLHRPLDIQIDAVIQLALDRYKREMRRQ
jgi:chemotaxis response regulator CheB